MYLRDAYECTVYKSVAFSEPHARVCERHNPMLVHVYGNCNFGWAISQAIEATPLRCSADSEGSVYFGHPYVSVVHDSEAGRGHMPGFVNTISQRWARILLIASLGGRFVRR